MPKVELKKRHPALIALNILLSGEPVLVAGEEWRYQDGVFGVVRKQEDGKTGVTEDIVLGVDMTLAGFVKWCEKLPEEAILQSIFNKVVHEEMGKPR
jgi:hypothetical protein